ncbi:MAG TPA: PspC domain-containing protein [Acidimicrobiales bacterium]|nr:PspC domain-containing protein [Acidimicrobiales bacterium]
MIVDMDQQASGTTAPPPFGGAYGATPPPYPPPHPGPPASRRLRRSRTNRCIAGVAGGLSDYLGVDATALRIAFVIVSVVFLAVFGGILLYVLAWALVPEDAPGTGAGGLAGPGGPSSTAQHVFSGRPWHDWDRSARSWAIVLGAVVLAIAWSFGTGPGLHWGALPFVLVLAAIAVWALTRYGPPSQWHHAFGGPDRPPGPAAPTGAPGAPPGSPVPSSPPPSPAADDQWQGGQQGGQAYGEAPGSSGSDPHPAEDGPEAQAAADWSAAQWAAAGWAKEQLQAAGVPTASAPQPGPAPGPAPAPGFSAPGSSPQGPPGTQGSTVAYRPPCRRQRGTSLVAVLSFLAVVVVVAVLAGGGSFRGGVGASSYAPSSVAEVHGTYREGIGSLHVDLSAVTFSAAKTVDMSVGIGELSVVVPRDASVTVNARTGIGNVDVLGVPGSGARRNGTTAAGNHGRDSDRLTIDAHVGVGDLVVTRAR